MKKPLLLLGGTALAAVLMAAACGTGAATSVGDQQKSAGEQPAGSDRAAVKSPVPTSAGGAAMPKAAAQTVVVSFTDSGFSPASVSLNVGDVLKIVNNSDQPLQPASDPHLLHTSNTQLNAKAALATGQSFSTVALTKTGSFGMHNHLNPSQKLTVVVK